MNSNAHNTSAPTAGLHRFKALSCALVCAGLLWAGSASAQVPVTDGAHISTQIGQWVRNYQQWQEQFNRWTKEFRQNAISQITGVTGVVGSPNGAGLTDSDRNERANQYSQTIKDFNNNNSCLRMSDAMAVAKSLCTTRHNIEVAKLNKLIELLKYTDNMNDKIDAAAQEVASANGTDDPADLKAKMDKVNLLQNQLNTGVAQRSDEFKTYDAQIRLLKEQQAEAARVILQGKLPTVGGALTQAVAIKGAFNAIKSTPSNNRTY